MKNALTIDLEDWYQGNDFSIPVENWGDYEDRIVESTERLLTILTQHGVKATFFVLGYLAQSHPSLIKTIDREGHEIASHGWAHRLLYHQRPKKFREELKKSLGIIEGIIGKKVKGFRAPSWSITKKSLWALDILQQSGMRYDSSIYPTRTHLYGLPFSPRYPYNIREGLVEFPPSTIRILGVNLPFGGGFFNRLLPYKIIKWGIERINREGEPALIYLHPWELDTSQPRIKLPLFHKKHYFHLQSTEEKLEKLLTDFSFSPISRLLSL